ncbi:MAG TPA: TIGR03936 family radical SAM-associated protein [Bacillota bacterium]|nr:TIGR03936 family radical SAM-associated protein [Bacillota bacterium]
MVEYRLRFSKEAHFKFLSHLELVKTFERALRRAEIAVAYSEGFHPHPQLSFGPALAVGLSSIDEYFDLELLKEYTPEELMSRLNPVLPSGLQVTAVRRCLNHVKPLNAIINRAAYIVELSVDAAIMPEITAAFEALLNRTEILVTRTNKNGTKTVDIRPWLHNLKTEIVAETKLQLRLTGEIGSGGNLRPEELLDLITHPVEVLNIVRVGLWHEQDGIVKKPLDFC